MSSKAHQVVGSGGGGGGARSHNCQTSPMFWGSPWLLRAPFGIVHDLGCAVGQVGRMSV